MTPDQINDPAFNKELNTVLGSVTGQCGDYITSTAAAARRRRSLLQGGVTITSTVAASDPAVCALPGSPSLQLARFARGAEEAAGTAQTLPLSRAAVR